MGLEVKGDMIKRGEKQMSGTEKKEDEENKINPSDYSCEVILEKTTKDKADDRKLPSDAFNVFYVVEGEERLDVTRSGKMVNVFDFYYDKYRDISNKRGFFGEIKFVISYDVVWIYVMID